MLVTMALKLKMTERQVHNVAMGAIMHDIGLKYISAPYINLDIDDMTQEDAVVAAIAADVMPSASM